MKTKTVLLALGLAIGFAFGFYRAKLVSDEDWSRRAITGVAVDCYDSKGNLIVDTG